MSDPHVFPVRVYYEDTDAGGVVYYAQYLKFAERARTEMMRALGTESSWLMSKGGIALAARQVTADYLKPARLDDLLEVHTTITEVKGASVRAEQIIRRDGEDLVVLALRLGCVNMTGGAARLPEVLRNKFKELCNP